MNKLSKGILISTLTVIYILGVSFVQENFRNGHDVGTGILYLYSSLLFVISFILSFSVYGISRKEIYISYNCPIIPTLLHLSLDGTNKYALRKVFLYSLGHTYL